MYHVDMEADWVETQSRLTTFFRIILLIPIAIVAVFWGVLAVFTAIGAWLAISFTGRYPEGLYAFNSGVVRFFSRLNAYQYLLVDRYPPWGVGEEPGWPVRYSVGPRPESQSRLRAFLRLIWAIPAMIGSYVANLVMQAIAIACWFVIVFTGKLPRVLYEVQGACIRYQLRVSGYLMMLTDEYPPLLNFDPPAPALAGGATAPPLGASPESPVSSPPSASDPPAAPASWEPPRPGGAS